MDTNKLVVVECLDKYEVVRCDEDVVKCFDESVLACLDNNNKDDFDGDFLHASPLEKIIEEILGEKCLVHHGYMKKKASVRPMPTYVITINIKPDYLS